jgi:alkanesulfonate monooxygenase SsuD/methylene tetrahydromethanopterin reductase-like flavin-dependent oxidoreductase (luciferase family)
MASLGRAIGMRVGVTLPQFREEADTALAAAVTAEALGLDGVFLFDHLWPMGQPGRPAISAGPLLGALVATTETIAIGTLVARVGLVPDDVLVAMFCGLSALSGGRIIAGVGTGDHLSRAENEAFGLPFEPADQRRSRMAAVAESVGRAGIPVWIGGGMTKTIALARSLGVPVNLWGAEPARVAELTADGLEVTWGGPLGGSLPAVRGQLADLQAAGATWAVGAWPDSLEMVAEATGDIRSGPSWPGQVGSRPSVTGAPGVVSRPLGDQR